MKIEAKTRAEYLSKIGAREPDVRQLDEIIRAVASGLKPAGRSGMYGSMLGRQMKYRPKSATVDMQWPLLMLGVQKNYISLYACAVMDGQYIAEKYQGDLGKVSCGKSCIRFKKISDLNLNGIKSMLQDLNARYESGEKTLRHLKQITYKPQDLRNISAGVCICIPKCIRLKL